MVIFDIMFTVESPVPDTKLGLKHFLSALIMIISTSITK